MQERSRPQKPGSFYSPRPRLSLVPAYSSLEQEVRAPIRNQFEELSTAGDDAVAVVRGLYRFYFESKPTSNRGEKTFLLSRSHLVSVELGVPFEQDQAIFAEESRRYYERLDRESPPQD